MKKEKIYDVLLYGIFVILMVLAIYSKQNLYVDEVYSFGLSNNVGGIYMPVEDGVTYYPANTPWIDYMTVDSENRFDYGNVWENQSMDVHPPLYYMILHTICSLFPGSISVWFAGLINIFFAIGTLFFLRKTVMVLTGNKLLQRLISVAFICSAGMLLAVTFLRMYILAMFWVTALTYLIIKQIGEKNTLKTYLLFLCVTTGGALTHYYCIVYTVFISVSYGCYLLYNKYWKDIGLFCLTQGVSAIVSIGIFPAMIGHILSSGRGTESVNNLVDSSMSIGLKRLKVFFDIVDAQLFGGIFIYIFFSVLLLVLVCGKWKTFQNLFLEDKVEIIRYVCILIPVILYFLLVSRIAVFVTDRYMYPIYAVLFALVLCGSSVWIQRIAKQQAIYVCVLLMVVMNVNSWKNANWEYLYQNSQPLLEAASTYSDVDCLYVYEKPWEINSSYYEVSKYHSVTFLTQEELDSLSSLDISGNYHLIVTVTSEDEEVLERILNICPSLNTYDYIGGYAYTNTYYLYGAQ